MKKKELRKVDLENLKEMVSLKKGELLKLKLDISRGQSEGNVREIRQARRELAQFLTIIKEKERHVK